jgi:hypothetical protein
MPQRRSVAAQSQDCDAGSPLWGRTRTPGQPGIQIGPEYGEGGPQVLQMLGGVRLGGRFRRDDPDRPVEGDRIFLLAELRPEEARTAGHRGFFLFDGF